MDKTWTSTVEKGSDSVMLQTSGGEANLQTINPIENLLNILYQFALYLQRDAYRLMPLFELLAGPCLSTLI